VLPQRSKRVLSPIILLSIAFPVVLFAALFLIYSFILNNIAENLLSVVP